MLLLIFNMHKYKHRHTHTLTHADICKQPMLQAEYCNVFVFRLYCNRMPSYIQCDFCGNNILCIPTILLYCTTACILLYPIPIEFQWYWYENFVRRKVFERKWACHVCNSGYYLCIFIFLFVYFYHRLSFSNFLECIKLLVYKQ